MAQCKGKRGSGTVLGFCLVQGGGIGLWNVRFSILVRPSRLPPAHRTIRLFGLWSVYVPPTSLGPVGFRIVPGSLGCLDRLQYESAEWEPGKWEPS